MPYKDRERQLQAQRDHYARQRQTYKDRNTKRRERFRQILNDLKDVPCADCGGRFPSVCMDFDHLPGEVKSFQVGTVGHASSEKRLLEEVAKCEIVCANCHRIRTWKRKQY